MPSRSLSYEKIMPTVDRTTSLLDCFVEVQLILSKDNAKIRVSERNVNSFTFPNWRIISNIVLAHNSIDIHQ